jgi:hypothetical protein
MTKRKPNGKPVWRPQRQTLTLPRAWPHKRPKTPQRQLQRQQKPLTRPPTKQAQRQT